MNAVFKKITAVVLCLCMLLGVCVTGAFAAETSDTVTVSYQEDLKNLEYDAPVILVEGIGGTFYKAMSTETPDDDVQIWGMPADVILDAVFSNIGKLLVSLIFNNYDALTELLGAVAQQLFGDFSCDENGNPDPDTYIDRKSNYLLKEGFGYENAYTFVYDWRYDMSTIAAQLDEYIEYIMSITGSDKVVLTSMSMGTAVLMTYLYEYYYTDENYAERNHIEAVVFIAGAMNGVACCGDPFSGNISVDSTSFMRFLSEVMSGNSTTEAIYKLLEFLYVLGAVDPLANYVNNLTQELIEHGFNNCVTDNIATIPGFYALMSQEQYAAARAFIFDTPEKQEKYAEIIRKNDYYHDCVQANGANIIQSLLDNGINTAIIAEYGYSMIPLTSNNDRMTDGTIMTEAESFGATCAEVDGTLGDGYIQAKECACGKNHVSADNQIDASTCAFPDITWFGKYLRHTCADEYIADLVNLIAYSDEQITVWNYSDLPQFMVNLDGDSLAPLTADNAAPIVPYEETVIFGKLKAKIKDAFTIC